MVRRSQCSLRATLTTGISPMVCTYKCSISLRQEKSAKCEHCVRDLVNIIIVMYVWPFKSRWCAKNSLFQFGITSLAGHIQTCYIEKSKP